MAQDMNTVALVGRLAFDPELRSLPGGTSVCQLRVAFTTSKKTQSGWEDESNFIDVTVWGNQGEAVAKHLSKGKRVGVSGRLQHRTWEDKDGNKREKHSITANSIQYLSPKDEDGGAGSQSSSSFQSHPSNAPVGDDDDIPF